MMTLLHSSLIQEKNPEPAQWLYRGDGELTFLYNSLQNVHIVFLCHSTERRELGLGDELEELERRKRRL